MLKPFKKNPLHVDCIGDALRNQLFHSKSPKQKAAGNPPKDGFPAAYVIYKVFSKP